MAALETITPATSPISVSQLRDQCRIDHPDEDDLLADYLAAAVEHVAEAAGIAIGRTVYRLTLDRLPADVILLPRPACVSVDAFAWTDSDGADQSLADPDADLQIDLSGQPARIAPLPGQSWPAAASDRLGVVRITFTAGSDAGVPARALQAIRLTAGTWYANRESVSERRMSVLPHGADRLIGGMRFRDRRLERFLAEH